MLEESRPVENFELNAGRLCLDFINTLSDRFLPASSEVLHTYTDLLIWSQQAKILEFEQARRLQSLAEQQPTVAAHWLTETKQTRELLFQMFSLIASGQAVPSEPVHQFNHVLSQTMHQLCLVPRHDSFAWSWCDEEDRLELPLWYSVRDAAELLASPDLKHVRICASDQCDWLFLDTSKNHSRRWCDMKVCGNRAKARRYYGRQRLVKERETEHA